MQNSIQKCVDCGSLVESTVINKFQRDFKMKQVHFTCGAVLTSSYSAQSQIGKVTHEGCLADEKLSAPANQPVKQHENNF